MNENQIKKLVALNKELLINNKKCKKLSDELARANEKLIKSEEKTIKIQQLYAFISQVNQNIVKIKDESTLFQNACRMALEFGKFKMAWIGIFDKEYKKISIVGHSGISNKDVNLFTNTTLQSKGPQTFLLNNNTHYLCNNVENDLGLGIWKSFAVKNSILSYMVVPIKKSGKIVGSFNLYSTELNFAGKEEIALLLEVSRDISFALDRLEIEKAFKNTEKLLAESEKRFRALIEKGNDLITLRSADGKLLYVSPSVVSMMGYSYAEILGKSIIDFIHPDDKPGLDEQTKIILKTPGSSLFREQRYLNKKGNWIWCEGTITNLIDTPGINALVSNFKNISDRKLIEQQREFDSNNLDALINNTEDLMWSVDTDFNLIISNEPFDEMLIFLNGSKIDKGKNTLNLRFPKEQLERFKAYYERAFAGETFIEIEFTESPHEIWSEISFYPIRKGDKVIGTACHSRNITNIKKSEQQLNASLERLKEAQVLANTGSWEFDIKKNVHIWSDHLYTIFGIKKELTNPSTEFFLSLIHPDDVEEIRIKVEQTFENLNATSYHFRFIRNDGQLRYGYTERKFEFDENNKPIRLLGVVQDITERKLAENELLQEQKNLKESQAITHLGNWELDFGTGIALWSDESCRIYGLSPKKNKHSFEDWISFIHPDDLNYVMKEIGESQKTLGDLNLNHRIVLKNGTIKYIYSYSRFNFDMEGNPVGIYGISHDITERKIAEINLNQQNEELLKTNSELDRFVYSVSHDLRSPLTTILGLLSFIENESNEPHTLQYAGMIKTSIIRQDEFIKNILSYSQNNRAEIKIEQIDVQKNLDEIVDSLRTIKNTEGINIEIDLNETTPFYSDKLRFNIVMENLISNAIKYHKKDIPGRYIKVKGHSDNDNLYISIEDNGIGIASEFHNKIFDMFFRLSSYATGSGIGLYIVKETIAKLHGTIEISSEKDRGTTFYIVLKNLKP